LPEVWNFKLDSFEKLIFLKCLRADKLIEGIQNWVSEKLGEKFVNVPTVEIAKCYKDSIMSTPLIFILSSGSDPIAEFIKFAEENNMAKRVQMISLGQGQGPKADRLVMESVQRGGWVMLQNCHLATSWMPELERICEQFDETIHKDFRLWLTSMPSSKFPCSVLQNGVKMTTEPPKGLKNNLLRTYNNISEEELNACSKFEAYRKLLFGFCLFHAIVQDRRKFGAIGWNIPYEFTNEDLTVCKRQLVSLLNDYEEIPFKVLNFLGAEINYGGRVTDDKDVRLIKTILALYCNPQVLREGYKFSESGIYIQPTAGEKEVYLNHIN